MVANFELLMRIYCYRQNHGRHITPYITTLGTKLNTQIRRRKTSSYMCDCDAHAPPIPQLSLLEQ
jgi:hypothetical protein